jgi:hypothetical protein
LFSEEEIAQEKLANEEEESNDLKGKSVVENAYPSVEVDKNV